MELGQPRQTSYNTSLVATIDNKLLPTLNKEFLGDGKVNKLSKMHVYRTYQGIR